jgi:hypothetical protein
MLSCILVARKVNVVLHSSGAEGKCWLVFKWCGRKMSCIQVVRKENVGLYSSGAEGKCPVFKWRGMKMLSCILVLQKENVLYCSVAMLFASRNEKYQCVPKQIETLRSVSN